MGCGGSTAANDKGQEKGGKYEEKPPPAQAQPKQKEPAAAPAAEKKPAASPPPSAPAAQERPKSAEPQPDTVSPMSSPQAGASVTAGGREKSMPNPILATCAVTEQRDCSCLVSAAGNNGDFSGLTIATYNMQKDQAYVVHMTDDDLTKTRDSLSTPPLTWSVFWKMFASAMSKADVKVLKDGTEIEIRMKQSKGEPKEVTLRKELEKTNDVHAHFLKHIPRVYAAKRQQLEDEQKDDKKDDKKLKESDISKKEAEFNLHEALLIAAAEAELLLEPRVETLRQEAKEALRLIGATQGGIGKTKMELEAISSGAPSHPLDSLYSAGIVPPLPEPSAVEVSELHWETDVLSLSTPLCDIALALFQRHGLIDEFKMDPDVVRNFFNTVESKCVEVPFHGRKRCVDCLVIMNFILESLQGTVKFTKEDILSALLSGAILDIDHEGYDDQHAKRAGSMLSMLYSDVYAINQNNLTVAAELFFIDQCNLLVSLTPDQNKDVIESVREALFIKANVQMKSPLERLDDFKQLVHAGNTDWSNKDNTRHVLTHAVRMTDWNAWGRPKDIHQKYMQMMAEEYYRQGDKELSIGLAPSNFWDTCWSTDRSTHATTFARGQAEFIDSILLPLFEVMSKLGSGLTPCVTGLKANRDAFLAECGDTGGLKEAIANLPKVFTATGDGTVLARVGSCKQSLWITLTCTNGLSYSQSFDDMMLAKSSVRDAAKFLKDLQDEFKDCRATTNVSADSATLTVAGAKLDMPKVDSRAMQLQMLPSIKSFLELRSLSAMRYVDRKLEEVATKATAVGNKSGDLHGEEKALKGCVVEAAKTLTELKGQYSQLAAELKSKGRPEVTVEIEDALAIAVRNPLKAPLPPGVLTPPDRKEVDIEMLKIVKSRYYTKEGGAEEDLKEDPSAEAKHCNQVKPYLTSEFCKMTSQIGDQKRQQIYDILTLMDDWSYDVFDLQTVMSGGIAGENLRNQPDGGALFVTFYALVYKWQFMQKFNIDETVLLNWLSIVEAGYHPNPYHNSMHAADVLHVTHYILAQGGCKAAVRATDAEIFACLFAAAIHDYNHPGINNAFHVRSQNYLAILFNDRSVNENIHASSVFELMRMDEFNILSAFQGDDYTRMREDIVEFVLGTDMGLHSMFVTRFKKRIDETEMKMYRTKKDKNLALTMALKMADISNCGRPKNLYHGWCNVIVDEFFQQGDRERLQGMPVSPFMDRYTTVMSKGQIGFMNYIVMPLFECMGEFLEHMQMATSIVDENKGFWQNHEDW
eukprot:Rhum_TRINITY_DN14753_c16_g1::Rhum_TRINITY_DN14753_c16_g1_i1::g.118515::m.118515/K13755/PDE1; calcium/calmodulin-dependent 3',5'-cyclic nucleotide phosphodiesterase